MLGGYYVPPQPDFGEDLSPSVEEYAPLTNEELYEILKGVKIPEVESKPVASKPDAEKEKPIPFELGDPGRALVSVWVVLSLISVAAMFI